MTFSKKLLICCLYVLGHNTPIDISFDHGGHHIEVYNYVETGPHGLDIGVDFDIDDGSYMDLWWEIRKNETVNYNRLNEAIAHIVSVVEQ